MLHVSPLFRWPTQQPADAAATASLPFGKGTAGRGGNLPFCWPNRSKVGEACTAGGKGTGATEKSYEAPSWIHLMFYDSSTRSLREGKRGESEHGAAAIGNTEMSYAARVGLAAGTSLLYILSYATWLSPVLRLPPCTQMPTHAHLPDLRILCLGKTEAGLPLKSIPLLAIDGGDAGPRITDARGIQNMR